MEQCDKSLRNMKHDKCFYGRKATLVLHTPYPTLMTFIIQWNNQTRNFLSRIWYDTVGDRTHDIQLSGQTLYHRDIAAVYDFKFPRRGTSSNWFLASPTIYFIIKFKYNFDNHAEPLQFLQYQLAHVSKTK